MEFHDAVAARRTVREFADRPVEDAIVRRALQAGLAAPSNAHLKTWEFVLLRDKDLRRTAVVEHLKARDLREPAEVERFLKGFDSETLKEVYRRSLPRQMSMMLEAPEVLIVAYRMKPLAECRRHFDLNPLASVWMCIENILLALAAEGIYGCTYTPYEAGPLKAHLGIPEGFEIAAVIPFGYPAREAGANPAESLDPRLHIDRW